MVSTVEAMQQMQFERLPHYHCSPDVMRLSRLRSTQTGSVQSDNERKKAVHT